MLRYLLLFIGFFINQSCHGAIDFSVDRYKYDVNIEINVSDDHEFGAINHRYDVVPNLRYNCEKLSNFNLQKEAREGPFFAFEKDLVAAKGANPQALIDTTKAVLRGKAGFSGTGRPIILDSNLETRGLAAALRAKGFNVRSVSEIFGRDVGDPAINRLANQLGARVLTRDRGRQIGEGFGSNAVNVDSRIRGTDGIIRILGDGL